MSVKALPIENAMFCETVIREPLGFGPLVIAVKLTGEAGQ
jgi:hypothetical protein